MRLAGYSTIALVVACADPASPPTEYPDLFEQAWSESMRPGDLVLAVPGTGGYSTLGKPIEESVAQHPDQPVDGHDLLSNVEVLEAAIAAAQRAGFADEDLEAGAVELGVWGAGITKIESFRYHSLGGLDLTFQVIGGKSVCADGGIPENLPNYNGGNAMRDARDLYQRTQAWVGAHPREDRQIVLVSHSWGGIVAEAVAKDLALLEHDHGALPGASIEFVVAGGVPAFVPDFVPLGPGFRTVESKTEDTAGAVRAYEVNRPDDPVHSFDPHDAGPGHHYIIMFREEYRGWFGITTDELSCAGIPGQCPAR